MLFLLNFLFENILFQLLILFVLNLLKYLKTLISVIPRFLRSLRGNGTGTNLKERWSLRPFIHSIKKNLADQIGRSTFLDEQLFLVDQLFKDFGRSTSPYYSGSFDSEAWSSRPLASSQKWPPMSYLIIITIFVRILRYATVTVTLFIRLALKIW